MTLNNTTMMTLHIHSIIHDGRKKHQHSIVRTAGVIDLLPETIMVLCVTVIYAC